MAQTEQAPALLDVVKKNIRINHNALDDAEILPLIEAAKKELKSSGVVKLDEADPLIMRAVVAYAKAHFGYDNPEAERFGVVFNSLLNKLTQLSEYTKPATGGDESG